MGKRDSLIILTHKKAGGAERSPALNLNNEAGIQMWHESDEDALFRYLDKSRVNVLVNTSVLFLVGM